MLSSNEIYVEIIYPEETFDSVQSNNSKFDRKSKVHNPIYNKDVAFTKFNLVADEDSMMQNVFNILLTIPGERINNPEFGCYVHELIFSLYETEEKLTADILARIDESLTKYEQRVKLDKQQSFIIVNNENSVDAVLYIIVPTGSIKVIKVTLNSVG